MVLMSTVGCKDFTGAMINRFFLGCLEAAVTWVNCPHGNRSNAKSESQPSVRFDDRNVVSIVTPNPSSRSYIFDLGTRPRNSPSDRWLGTLFKLGWDWSNFCLSAYSFFFFCTEVKHHRRPNWLRSWSYNQWPWTVDIHCQSSSFINSSNNLTAISVPDTRGSYSTVLHSRIHLAPRLTCQRSISLPTGTDCGCETSCC